MPDRSAPVVPAALPRPDASRRKPDQQTLLTHILLLTNLFCMSPRASTADLLRRTALRMFTEQGFDAVPVNAIAKAAGVSHMTFFRHFPTKEAVVVSDLFDPPIAEAVRAQPQRWRPLTRAVRGLVAAMDQESAHEEMSSREFYERIRLAALTPSLAAAVRTAGQETERAIAAALIAPGVDDAAARAAAGAVMGAASSLLLAWAGENNAPDAGATGTATSTAGDAATVLSRGLLSLLGES